MKESVFQHFPAWRWRFTMMMTRTIVKLHVCGFSRRALEAHTTIFGRWIAGYWPVSDFGLVLNAWVGVLDALLGSFYVNHVRFDLCHPYIDPRKNCLKTRRQRQPRSSKLTQSHLRASIQLSTCFCYEHQGHSKYTGRDLILKLASTLYAKKSLNEHFCFLILATHRDCVEDKLDTWVTTLINNKLESLILSTFEDQLILFQSPDKQHLF